MGNGGSCWGGSIPAGERLALPGSGPISVEDLVATDPRCFPPSPSKDGKKASAGECLIFLESALDVPYGDVMSDVTCGGLKMRSHGQPFARAWVEAAGAPLGQVVEWSARHCNSAPSWFSAKPLGFSLADGLSRQAPTLHLELWDGKTRIGHGERPLYDSELHRRLELVLDTPLAPPAGRPCTVSFQVLDAEACLAPRTVLFVRHGESSWNRAQSKMDLYEMGRQNDHPLSEKGRDQAAALCKKIAEYRETDAGASASEVHQPDVVYVSPLTRAIQTAVIALGETLTAEDQHGKMVLMANAREKQNLGGFDSKPKELGTGVLQRALTELRGLYLGDAASGSVMDIFSKLRFDTQEVRDIWWHDAASEPASAVEARMQEFMAQLVYSPHKTIVVVGHSHFFRAVFRRYIAQGFKDESPAFAKRLGEDKLSNCGVARMRLDPRQPDSPIVGVDLLFDTSLSSDKGALGKCCAAPVSERSDHELVLESRP